MSVLNETYRWLDDDGAAFGAPGLEPRWTSSKKDAVSTAYAASSRIWFTASHGTLNEIYYPTIDRPQTRDMELLFTDEETFFHEEKRDFEYDFHYIDPDALAVRVVANDLGGRYTVTKEFITDPHHPVVLMHVKIDGDEEILSKLKLLRSARSASRRRRRRQLRPRARHRRPSRHPRLEERHLSRLRRRLRLQPHPVAAMSAPVTAIRTSATTSA